jgi:hypothetical protein
MPVAICPDAVHALERLDIERPVARGIGIGDILRDGRLADRQPLRLLKGDPEKTNPTHDKTP